MSQNNNDATWVGRGKMARRALEISEELAQLIRTRRIELGLTIENAANMAGAGTKTWSRYEAGGAISIEKVKGVCKALKWSELPDPDSPDFIYGKMSPAFDINYYRNHKYWSEFIESGFGEIAATSFVMGAEILFDYIRMDMQELQKLPKGSHIGQIDSSWLLCYMPEQFVTDYDYDFLFHMKSNLFRMCETVERGNHLVAHSVMDEIILMIMIELSELILEDEVSDEVWKEWIYDLMDDSDTEFFLYSNCYIDEGSQFHFSRWFDDIFWMG